MRKIIYLHVLYLVFFHLTSNAQCNLSASCSSGFNSASVTVSGGTPSYSYLWSNNATQVSISNLPSGNYSITVTDNTGCTATSAISVTCNPPPPGPIYGRTSGVCKSTMTYYLSIPGNNNDTWYPPAGATIASVPGTGQGTAWIAVAFSSSFTGGDLLVHSTNACGENWYQIAIKAIPDQPLRVGGVGTACPGSSGNYSVPTVYAATNYTWTAPPGAAISTGQGTNYVIVSFGASFTGGTLSVTASNDCGTTDASTRYIVGGMPPTAPAISGPSGGVCNSTQTYTVSDVPGATAYIWTVPAGATLLSGQGYATVSINFSKSFMSGTLSVNANNPCGNSPSGYLSVKSAPAAPSAIYGSANPCKGSTQQYWIDPASNASSYIYKWTVPGICKLLSGQGTTRITVLVTDAKKGDIKVNATNACGTGTVTSLTLAPVLCRLASETETKLEEDMVVYPNPVHDKLTLKFNSTKEDHYSIKLFDATGRLMMNDVKSILQGENEIELYLGNLPKAIYMLNLQTEDGLIMETKRIVVE